MEKVIRLERFEHSGEQCFEKFANSAEQCLDKIDRLLKQRAWSDVVDLCDWGIAHFEEKERFYFHLGEANLALGNTAAGVQAFEMVLKLAPSRIDCVGDLGGKYLAERHPGKARVCYSAILRKSETPPHWVHVGLGNASNQEGNIPGAIEHFRRALAIRSTPNLVERLIQLYCNLGREYEAADLHESLARTKDDAAEG